MAKPDSNGNYPKHQKGRTYGKEQENRLRNRREKLSKGSGEAFDWSTIPRDYLLSCITVMAAIGGAIRFGATRDGGALAVGFYLDNDSWTEYVRPGEDVQAYFENTWADLMAEAEARGIQL